MVYRHLADEQLDYQSIVVGKWKGRKGDVVDCRLAVQSNSVQR